MISFKSSFENDNVVVPNPSISSWIVRSVTGAAAVNPNGIKTLLANGLSTLLIKSKPYLAVSSLEL